MSNISALKHYRTFLTSYRHKLPSLDCSHCISNYIVKKRHFIYLGNGAFVDPSSTKTKKTLGDRAFSAAAPRLWKKLPHDIKDEDNL